MDSVKLSVLIATINGREKLFQKLWYHLTSQLKPGMPVEILYEKDNKEISIGAKRQKLLERAKGEYIVFIDDDDFVSNSYLDSILVALAERPDCVGFLIDCEFDERGRKRKASAISSLRYKVWEEQKDGFDYVRTIYHKTPVNRDIAMQVGFPDLRFGEDHPYAIGVTKLCKTEHFINEVMYYYRFKHEQHNKKYGIK